MTNTDSVSLENWRELIIHGVRSGYTNHGQLIDDIESLLAAKDKRIKGVINETVDRIVEELAYRVIHSNGGFPLEFEEIKNFMYKEYLTSKDNE